jgi:putative SOS response-associated peptidase YedK
VASRSDVERELAQAYDDYRSTMLRVRTSYDLTDEAAEAVLRARVRLTRALEATGWRPPPSVADQISRDEALTNARAEDLEAALSDLTT